VGDLIYQHQLGSAGENGIEVELLERAPMHFDLTSREQLQTEQECGRVHSVVCLGEANDQVDFLVHDEISGYL
jgi:hypothetical protein